MSFDSMQKIADAVLFEGYILYPYRPSAIKNRQRWNFGTLYPRDFAQAQKPEEAWSFHSEMIVEGDPASRIDLCIRFLQLVPSGDNDDQQWDHGVVRNWTIRGLTLGELSTGLSKQMSQAELAAENEAPAQVHLKEHVLSAVLEVKAENMSARVYRFSATVSNRTPLSASAITSRHLAQRSAFTSAHLLLHIEAGAFVSMLEPPPALAGAVSACNYRGVFPVLTGDAGNRRDMLCSPIIFYDYPQIAPESAGDFFDGTEMDEMLALRVMTLSDEEKQEMRRGDPYARKILERTESLPQEHLLKVHGALRGMSPANEVDGATDGAIQSWNPFEEKPPLDSITVFGIELHKGDRVRLWPQKRADIMDMAMKGHIAMIEAIEQDLDDNVQLAVVLDDDPGKDLGMLRQPGHRFFFAPEEVEPLNLQVR